MSFKLGKMLLALLLMTSLAHAAQRAMTIEDFYRVRNMGDIAISPDGKRVAFTLASTDLAKAQRNAHIWVMNPDGSGQRQVTFSDKSEGSPVFSPDGKYLAFVTSREGDENLYLLPLAGGEARKLTSASTGVAGPVFSPDGNWVAFSSDVYPECGADDACNKKIAERWSKGKLQGHMADGLLYRHWTEWKDGKRTHILLVSTACAGGGTCPAARDLTPGDFDSPPFDLGGAPEYEFSPDGREFVFVSNHDAQPASSTNSDLWLLALDSTGGEAIPPRNITASNPAYDGTPHYSPDGRYIGYRMQKQPGYESDLFRLAVYDRAAGASRVLTESFRNWVDDFRWSPDSASLYFIAPVEGNTPIYQVDLKGQIHPVLEDKALRAWELNKDASAIIYARTSVGEPVEIYSAALQGGKAAAPARLTHFNDALAAEVDFRPAEKMWIKGADGKDIQTFIVKPHGYDPAKKYPLILNVHGGPQQQWADAFRGDWQVYPAAGYVVAFANPHGSTGYGQDFTAEISGDFGGKVYEDVMKVTDALAQLPYVDPNRIGAMGWSYGGYMMDWLEGHTDRFKAISSMMGMYDIKAFYGATEELWFPEHDMKGEPWNSADYEKFSPSNFVKNFKTPCLVITGERDYRVPYTQSLQFFTALQKMGVPSRLIVYSNAGHWPSWYEMALYYTAHLEWFQKYLGGAAPPWTTEQFLRNAVFDAKTGERVK
jgi:dipeptidyl aminopeptidase/acylaminoacyl peptidase